MWVVKKGQDYIFKHAHISKTLILELSLLINEINLDFMTTKKRKKKTENKDTLCKIVFVIFSA